MARIADKHGLTNRYRPYGSKRVVKRGRPRKHLFGAPSRRRNTYSRGGYNWQSSYDNCDVDVSGCMLAGMIAFCIFLLIFFLVIPSLRFLLPVIIGTALLFVVEGVCKKAWGLPTGAWSLPVSIGWIVITMIVMITETVLIVFNQINMVPLFVIVVIALAYTGVSYLILHYKYKKAKKRNKMILDLV